MSYSVGEPPSGGRLSPHCPVSRSPESHCVGQAARGLYDTFSVSSPPDTETFAPVAHSGTYAYSHTEPSSLSMYQRSVSIPESLLALPLNSSSKTQLHPVIVQHSNCPKFAVVAPRPSPHTEDAAGSSCLPNIA